MSPLPLLLLIALAPSPSPAPPPVFVAAPKSAPGAPDTPAPTDVKAPPLDVKAVSHPDKVRFSLRLGKGTNACPDAAQLRDAVAAQLGFDPFSAEAKRSVEIHIDSVEIESELPSAQAGPPDLQSVLRANVVLTSDGVTRVGERQIDSPQNDCDALARSVQLATAIAIDPMSILHPPPPVAPAPPKPGTPASSSKTPALSPSPTGGELVTVRPPVVHTPPKGKSAPGAPPSPTVAEKPVEASPLSFTPEAETHAPWRLGASVGAVAVIGTVPQIGLGTTLGLGLSQGGFSLWTQARYEPGGDIILNDGGRFSLQLISVKTLACYHAAWFFGCGSASGGGLWSTHAAPGLVSELRSVRPYLAVGARMGVQIPVWRFFVRLHVDTSVPLVVYDYNRVQPAAGGGIDSLMYTLPPVNGAAGLAVGFLL